MYVITKYVATYFIYLKKYFCWPLNVGSWTKKTSPKLIEEAYNKNSGFLMMNSELKTQHLEFRIQIIVKIIYNHSTL